VSCYKIAGNIALGRDAAGVRYRSDSIKGVFVGEEQTLLSEAWILSTVKIYFFHQCFPI
jgi:hypothetical protein